MIRTLAAIAGLPLLFCLYSSLEDTVPVFDVQQSITSLTEQDSGPSPFSLGNDRTVDDALNSCSFAYGDCSRF